MSDYKHILAAVQEAIRTGSADSVHSIIDEANFSMCDNCPHQYHSDNGDIEDEDIDDDGCGSCPSDCGTTLEKMANEVGDVAYRYSTDYFYPGYCDYAEGLVELKECLGITNDYYDDELMELFINSRYGTVRIYFADSLKAFLPNEINTKATHITFTGTVHVGIVDSTNGSGHVIALKLNKAITLPSGQSVVSDQVIKLPFRPVQLRIDVMTHYNWTEDICGRQPQSWCDTTEYRLSEEVPQLHGLPLFNELFTGMLKDSINLLRTNSSTRKLSMCAGLPLQFVEGIENGCLGDEVYEGDDDEVTPESLETRVAASMKAIFPNLEYNAEEKMFYHNVHSPSVDIEKVDFNCMYPIQDMDAPLPDFAENANAATALAALQYCLSANEVYRIFMIPFSDWGIQMKEFVDGMSAALQWCYVPHNEADVAVESAEWKLRLVGALSVIIQKFISVSQNADSDDLSEIGNCEFIAFDITEGDKRAEAGVYPLTGELMS